MSDRLVPLLRVYGEDLHGDAVALPGGDSSAEEALLRSTKAALDAAGRPAPPSATIEAILDAARAAAHASELAPIRSVMAGHVAGGPTAESDLLRTTWAAVTRMPRPSPPANIAETVLSAAREASASSDLAALRAVLAGEAAPGHLETEAEVLRTSLRALEGLPRPAPPAETVAAVTAAAGLAARDAVVAPMRSALDGTVPAVAGAEHELLRTTWEAVGRLPRPAPPIDAVQAVLAAAHAALPAPLRDAAAARRASDRPAVREARSFRQFAYLTATVAFVGLVGVGLWASRDGRPEGTHSVTALEEGGPAPGVSDAPPPPAITPVEQDAGSAAAPSVGGALASADVAPMNSARRSTSDGADTYRAPPPPPPTPSPVPVATPPAAFFSRERAEAVLADRVSGRTGAPSGAGLGLAAAMPDRDASPGAGLAGAPAVTPVWEAGTDVRLLSLRLQTLREQSAGVAWDEPPAPLGAAEAGETVPQGFDAVGTRSAPARFQVRVGPPGSD